MKNKTFISLLVIVVFCLASFQAFAQDDLSKILKGTDKFLKGGQSGISVSIGEDRFNYSAKQGDRITGTFVAYNRNAFSAMILLESQAVEIDSTGDIKTVPLASVGSGNLSRHISFQPNKFTMPPQSQKNVQFSISVPKNISGGTHYAAFSIQSMPIQQTGKRLKQKELVRVSEVGFSPALRGLITVDIGGSGRGAAVGPGGFDYEIVSAETFQSGGGVGGNVTLESRGSSQVALTVAAVVLDSNNNVVARLRPKEKTVLKPKERKVVNLASSAASLEKGKYQVKFTVLGEKAATKTMEKTLVIR